jgi:hypothetical protein
MPVKREEQFTAPPAHETETVLAGRIAIGAAKSEARAVGGDSEVTRDYRIGIGESACVYGGMKDIG